MRILVIGGTRFFGIPMIEKLLNEGHDVTIATRGNAVNPFGERVSQLFLDRTDPAQVKEALEGKSFDVMIDKIAYSSNDVKTLLENTECERYIQMSSCAVYGSEKEMIAESEFDPASCPLKWQSRTGNYAEGKRLAERAALEYLDASRCVFVRYPVVLGEHDYTGRLKFYIDHVLQGKAMNIDDMDCGMSFIHEKEAGEFIAFLSGKDFSGAVNGCSGGMITLKEIISYIEKQTGKKAVLREDGDKAPYNGRRSHESFDTSEAGNLGYRFSSLSDWIFPLIDTYIRQSI